MTWQLIGYALAHGDRGLPQGSSLARLLARRRGVRNRKAPPPLTEDQIVTWAAQYIAAHGRRPKHISGPIDGAPGETWGGVHAALYQGSRGLPGGDSLYQLLKRHGLAGENYHAKISRSWPHKTCLNP
jgi:hypothetical protein